MTPAALAKRNRMRIVLAFAAVYVLWGSTYLFIKYAIETMPPFFLGFTRFAASGGLLLAYALWRGASKPTAWELKMAAITGVLMLGFGNGAVMWAEKTIPSGVVALIVSSVPIWVVIIDWLRPGGVRPRTAMFVGLVLGLAGIVTLVGPRAIIGEGNVDEIGALVMLAGSVAWAVGSLLTRGNKPRSPILFSALQMLAASAAMAIIGVVNGDMFAFSPASLTPKSVFSFVYLVFAGSIIGFTAYVYLLGVVSAAKAATYAYVNPVIAVLLGWGFAGEPLGLRTMVAAAVVLAGVAIITTAQGRQPKLRVDQTTNSLLPTANGQELAAKS
jgi:drug/metabolite transporter (DMT)-like permease